MTQATQPQASSVRIHTSFLAKAEKRALIWLAERTPAFINSDHLTLLGLFAMVGAGVCYWLASKDPVWLWGVNLCLILNWAGDSLDGTLARVRDCQRPMYGYYVDHVCDSIAALFMFGGMAVSGFMNPWVGISLLIAYYLLSIESYLAAHALKEFHISHFGFGPTELRLLLFVGNIALFYKPYVNFFGTTQKMYDVGGVGGAIGLGGAFAITAIRHTITLYRRETR